MQSEKSNSMPLAIMASAFLLTFAVMLPMFCIPPMEHIIKEELNLTHAQTSWLLTIPVLVTAILSIPCGVLADRMGIRKAAGTGAILIAIGSTLRGVTTDYPTLLAFTVIIGVGGTLILPNLPKLVSLWVPREKAATATGIYSTGTATGSALPLAITLPVIFPITNTFQGTFLIWSIPTIIAAIVWWIVVRDPPAGHMQTRPTETDNISLRQILSNKILWLIAILLFIRQFYNLNWTTWAPSLMMGKGASAELAAVMASVTMWVAIPAFLLIPRLSDKLGLRKPFLWVSAITMALVAWWAIYGTVPMGWPIMTLVGLANNAMYLIIITLPIELMPRKVVGTATGLIMSIGFSGGVIGPLAGGYILDITGSLNISLLVLIAASIIAIIISLRIPETGPKAGSP